MILVTLGTQKFSMNRLIKAADKMAEKLDEEVFIQTGHSTYEPLHCKHSSFVNRVDFADMIANCSVLITHAGVGSIMTGLKASKPIICVPRLSKLGEHVDDHQQEIAKAFDDKKYVLVCNDVNNLVECVKKAKKHHVKPYKAPKGNIEDIILDFIDKN